MRKTWLEKYARSPFPLYCHSSQLRKIATRSISIWLWQIRGRPLPPPPAYKAFLINQMRRNSGCTIFIETGTYLGDMVEAQRISFEQIYSIELSADLFSHARERFASYRSINIIHGDSGKVLKDLVKTLEARALFWLDGHYSGGRTAKGDTSCPILAELDAIFHTNRFNHVILVDDARCFTGERGFPNINELLQYIRTKDPEYKIIVENDIIIATRD
jgi:hypothetical protein